MEDYYSKRQRTVANSEGFSISEGFPLHFPEEGLFIGKLKTASNGLLPALIDLQERPAICFLYDSEDCRNKVNNCIERLVWRIASTVPPNLCRFLFYSGEDIGQSVNTTLLLNNALFYNSNHKVYYEGTANMFGKCLDEVYNSILSRMSAISIGNKDNLVELNDSLGKDAVIPYLFIVLSSLPYGLSSTEVQQLSRIVKSGYRAGIYVLLSWDIRTQLNNKYSAIDPSKALEEMEIVYPVGNHFLFKNSGHDDVLKDFVCELDGEGMDRNTAILCTSAIDQRIEIFNALPKRDILAKDYRALREEPYVQTDSELNISIGIDITTKHEVSLKFNAGDYIHAFILGQSGSGKSVLLNNIITSAILKYSPSDLVLYLMDFKGVEFNRYRGEKHTKAVLVDNSDPQMTLEVLRELYQENKTRIKLWQREGVNNIDSYNKRNPQNRIPQILFVADECQVMFQMPRVGGLSLTIHREITDILNTIATQGRSQGIHMLLATQQLDETDISGLILKNLTECLLLMSAPSDSNRLVPYSSELTEKQATGIACYYHKKELKNQVQTYFAGETELRVAITSAMDKSKNLIGNGEFYFNGSSSYRLTDLEMGSLLSVDTHYPTALIGRNIGLKSNPTTIHLRDDYSENVLFFGANNDDQTISVLMNAMICFIASYRRLGSDCKVFVIDCCVKDNSEYKTLLGTIESYGLCTIVDRRSSVCLLREIANNIYDNCACPAIIIIIGAERYIEMKRNSIVGEEMDNYKTDIGGIESLSFDDPFEKEPKTDFSRMTIQQVFSYILEDGPMLGVHTLLQVDKPGNILFEGDYGINATDKFRHKVILRSENKYLSPLRFSHDIDVENLNDDEEHLRAYYYPEGDAPVLFTPFQLPEQSIINNLI